MSGTCAVCGKVPAAQFEVKPHVEMWLCAKCLQSVVEGNP